jgi:RNA polymerase sigma factor (sigma-70 family)
VSYIYKVAVSATLRAIRRTKARREEQLHDDLTPQDAPHDSVPADGFRTHPNTSPYAVAERREWVRKIDRAMTRLAENRRRAVGLHLRGLTTREIGSMLGWSEPKARNLVHRGMRDLRGHLRSEGIAFLRASPR